MEPSNQGKKTTGDPCHNFTCYRDWLIGSGLGFNTKPHGWSERSIYNNCLSKQKCESVGWLIGPKVPPIDGINMSRRQHLEQTN